MFIDDLLGSNKAMKRSAIACIVIRMIHIVFMWDIIDYLMPDLSGFISVLIYFFSLFPIFMATNLLHNTRKLEDKIDTLTQLIEANGIRAVPSPQQEQPVLQSVAYQNAQVSQEIMPSAPNPPEQ